MTGHTLTVLVFTRHDPVSKIRTELFRDLAGDLWLSQGSLESVGSSRRRMKFNVLD